MNTLSLSLLLVLLFSLKGSCLEKGSTFECNKEGRFPDPSDCGYYFECIPNEEGSLTPYKRSCYGSGFNPQTLSCSAASEIEGCVVIGSRRVIPAKRYNDLCTNPEVKYACADCRTTIMCDDGNAFPIKCDKEQRCVPGIDNFSGAVCYPKYNESCKCRERNTYYQDPYDNRTFFLCEEENAIPLFYTCPKDTYFNVLTSSCLSEDGLPVCTKEGSFDHPKDCRKYYSCILASEGWIQTRLDCPKGEYFNKYTKNCESFCSTQFRCSHLGRFKNPLDCNKYFECLPGENDEFMEISRTCPPNLVWNDDERTCTKSKNSDCKPVMELPEECKSQLDNIDDYC